MNRGAIWLLDYSFYEWIIESTNRIIFPFIHSTSDRNAWHALTGLSQKKEKKALLGQYVCFYTLNSFENVKSHCEVHTEIQRRYLHRQIFNILFCPQSLSTVLKSLWRNWCICEYTFAFKKKSTQKLTDLVEVKEIFS